MPAALAALPARSKRARTKEIQHFVGLCLMSLEKRSVRELAHRTGLGQETIRRLRKGKASLHTHVGTVQAVGLAAGLELKWTKDSSYVKLLRLQA